jgi:hypothetical protein
MGNVIPHVVICKKQIPVECFLFAWKCAVLADSCAIRVLLEDLPAAPNAAMPSVLLSVTKTNQGS